MSKKELAQKVGVSEGAIRGYELGTRNPKEGARERLAEVLGLTPASLNDFDDCGEEQVLHFFMQLEGDELLEPVMVDGQPYLKPSTPGLAAAVRRWAEQAESAATGECSPEGYDDWKSEQRIGSVE